MDGTGAGAGCCRAGSCLPTLPLLSSGSLQKKLELRFHFIWESPVCVDADANPVFEIYTEGHRKLERRLCLALRLSIVNLYPSPKALKPCHLPCFCGQQHQPPSLASLQTPSSLRSSQSQAPADSPFPGALSAVLICPGQLALPFPLFPSNRLPGSSSRLWTGLPVRASLPASSQEPLSSPCRTNWNQAGTQWGLQSHSSESVSVQPFHPNLQALLGHFPRKPFLRVTEPGETLFGCKET